MVSNTVKILLLIVILIVLGYVYKQNSGTGIIGVSGEPAEKASEEIVNRDCSGTEYILQNPCSRNDIVLDGLTDETSGAGFETHVLDKNHEGFVRQLGDGVCPPKLVGCNVDPPKPCSGNTWLDELCVRLDANGNELILEDGNANACGDGILKQNLDTNAPDYKAATKGGLCTFEKSGTCQKTCPEPQPPVCNYPVLGWQLNDLGCVKSQNDLTPVGCGETGVIQRYKASTMNTEYCKELTEWVSCSTKPCPEDCEGSWSDWTPNPDACDVQPSESRIYSINKPAVGNTQYGYGRPCEEIHDKVETRSRQDPIQPCCIQNYNWIPAFDAHGGKCKPNGTGIFAQTTSGNCPDDVKSAIKDCCYESGEWKNAPGATCLSTGKIKQTQDTAGICAPELKIREIDCCYQTGWEKIGLCNSNGEQQYTRVVVGNCPENDRNQTKTEKCQYRSPSYGSWGQCDGVERKRTRELVNAHIPHDVTGESWTDGDNGAGSYQTETCRNCKGHWRQEYGAYSGNRRNRHKRNIWQQFHRTQSTPLNGGTCNLTAHGATRSHDGQYQTDSWFNTHPNSVNTILNYECSGLNTRDPNCN